MLIAINYHYVRPVFDAPYPGIHGITPDQFESQLRLLGQGGEFVSAADVQAAVRGGSALPDRALIVTFDDGLQEQYDHAVPVLRRLGIPALFFINTRPIATGSVSSVHKIHLLRANLPPGEFVERLSIAAGPLGIALNSNGDGQQAIEHYKYDDPQTARVKYLINFVLQPADRDAVINVLFDDVFGQDEPEISRKLYMTVPQIAELGRERWIGTHGHEHLPLGLLGEPESKRQIDESTALLESWMGYRPFALSYPYGSREASSTSVARHAVGAGITFAFTMERAGNPSLCGPLHLARFDNNDMPGGKASRWSIDNLFDSVAPRSWFTD